MKSREPSEEESKEQEESMNNEEETLETMARKALDCPCVADLRDGPCGKQFSEAFICYFKSTAEEKGSDCIKPFLAMQACMEASPEHFTKTEQNEDVDSSDSEVPDLLPRPRRRRSKSPPPPAHTPPAAN